MYDITSAETFTKAKYWVTELQKNASGNLGEQQTSQGMLESPRIALSLGIGRPAHLLEWRFHTPAISA